MRHESTTTTLDLIKKVTNIYLEVASKLGYSTPTGYFNNDISKWPWLANSEQERKSTTFGTTNYNLEVFYFNVNIYNDYTLSEEVDFDRSIYRHFVNTIVHELTHAYLYEGHTPTFKRVGTKIAKEVGKELGIDVGDITTYAENIYYTSFQHVYNSWKLDVFKSAWKSWVKLVAYVEVSNYGTTYHVATESTLLQQQRRHDIAIEEIEFDELDKGGILYFHW